MKILHAAKFYAPVRGGMETVLADLCDGTADDWAVQVVAANDRPRTTIERRGGADVARTRGPRLLFVGRLVYYKGVHVLLEAAREWPGTLIIVGDGPLEAEMRSRAAALGIADRIQFTGSLADDEVQAHYQACDALVLPSIARTEAFGVVQIEAMAAGLPVVSTRLPTGVPWVNQDGVSGIVVPPYDAASLGAALRCLAHDAALRTRLADGARRRAEALFSRERMVRAFKDVVETVVREPERLDEYLADVARPSKDVAR